MQFRCLLPIPLHGSLQHVQVLLVEIRYKQEDTKRPEHANTCEDEDARGTVLQTTLIKACAVCEVAAPGSFIEEGE